jgi:hypothetical protein
MGPSDLEPFSISLKVGNASVQRDFLAVTQRQRVAFPDEERGGAYDAAIMILEWVQGSYIFRQVRGVPVTCCMGCTTTCLHARMRPSVPVCR